MKIVIYLNKEKTSTHVLSPSDQFKEKNQIPKIVETIAPGYYSYEIFD